MRSDMPDTALMWGETRMTARPGGVTTVGNGSLDQHHRAVTVQPLLGGIDPLTEGTDQLTECNLI